MLNHEQSSDWWKCFKNFSFSLSSIVHIIQTLHLILQSSYCTTSSFVFLRLLSCAMIQLRLCLSTSEFSVFLSILLTSRNYCNACSQSSTMNISKPHEWVRIVCCVASCLSILWNLAPSLTLPLKVFDEIPVKSQCFVTSLAIHDALWFVTISTLINGMWFIKLFFILYKHLLVVVCFISDTGIYFINLRAIFTSKL